MMRRIILALIGLGFIGAGIGYYLYNKPMADLNDVTAAYQLTATELYEAFEADEAAAQTQYLGKILDVTGVISEVEMTEAGGVNLSLEGGGLLGGVRCRLEQTDNDQEAQLEAGNQVTIRGECTGKLMDVELSRCVLINN
jgi:hypothetical protein